MGEKGELLSAVGVGVTVFDIWTVSVYVPAFVGTTEVVEYWPFEVY